MTKQGRDVVNLLINDRTAPTVTYRYRPGPQVRDSAEYVFGRLQAEDALGGLPPEDFVPRLVTYWGAIDSIHPFREGNTRTETVFFHSLCRNAGYDLGAERLYDRRAEFIAARFHGHATRDRYRRLTADGSIGRYRRSPAVVRTY
jgi:cell filamentation protein